MLSSFCNDGILTGFKDWLTFCRTYNCLSCFVVGTILKLFVVFQRCTASNKMTPSQPVDAFPFNCSSSQNIIHGTALWGSNKHNNETTAASNGMTWNDSVFYGLDSTLLYNCTEKPEERVSFWHCCTITRHTDKELFKRWMTRKTEMCFPGN